MQRAVFYQVLKEKYTDIEVFSEIERTCRKVLEHVGTHEQVMISVSGGSDSDCVVHLFCTYFPEFLDRCRFVFSDTGLEWEATREHLKYLEHRYGIKIDKVRGLSVVTAVRRYGVPIISKYHSQVIQLFCNDAPSGIRKMYAPREVAKGFTFSVKHRALAEAIKQRGIRVSDRCCKVSKKHPLDQYAKEHQVDPQITGERKLEGGQRSISHKSCFEEAKRGDKFMPLFWWSDKVKAAFKEMENIRYSDCYEVYGLRRTGCVGCPFNSTVNIDLKAMRQYEPGLFKACMNVFGESYRLMDGFDIRKMQVLGGLGV